MVSFHGPCLGLHQGPASQHAARIGGWPIAPLGQLPQRRTAAAGHSSALPTKGNRPRSRVRGRLCVQNGSQPWSHIPIRINKADARSAPVLPLPASTATQENRPQCGAVGGSVLPEGFSEKVGAREDLLAEGTRPARRATRPSGCGRNRPRSRVRGRPRSASRVQNRQRPKPVRRGGRYPCYALPCPQHGKPSPGLAKGHRSRVAAGKGGPRNIQHGSGNVPQGTPYVHVEVGGRKFPDRRAATTPLGLNRTTGARSTAGGSEDVRGRRLTRTAAREGNRPRRRGNPRARAVWSPL